MVKPSPAHLARLRFTTKGVARGFYRGNRAGAMGAHTEYGKYMIDWRKTTHFNVPDTVDFALSPFVTLAMERSQRIEERPDGSYYTPEKVDGLEFLRSWQRLNPYEHEDIVTKQELQRNGPTVTEDNQVDERIQEHEEEILTEATQSPSPQPTHTDTTEPAFEHQITSEAPSEMTRAERKEIVNAATTQQLRDLKKETGEKPTKKQKRQIKKENKEALERRRRDLDRRKQDLIRSSRDPDHKTRAQLQEEVLASGLFEDEKAYQKMMVLEGRDRKRAGLPTRTAAEKAEFLEEYMKKRGRPGTPGVAEEEGAGARPGWFGGLFK